MKTIRNIYDFVVAIGILLAVLMTFAFCVGLGWGLFNRALQFGLSLV